MSYKKSTQKTPGNDRHGVQRQSQRGLNEQPLDSALDAGNSQVRARRQIDLDAHKSQREAVSDESAPEVLSLQRRVLWTQVGLLVFGLFGLMLNYWQTHISEQSASTAKQSVQAAIDQFALQNRAYLTTGEASNPLDTFVVFTIPIVNTGHVPTGPSHLILLYSRMESDGSVPEKRIVKYDTLARIPPGSSAYFLTVSLPQLPQGSASSKGKGLLSVRGYMDYDDGFGKQDRLFIYYELKDGKWQNGSGQSMPIHLWEGELVTELPPIPPLKR